MTNQPQPQPQPQAQPAAYIYQLTFWPSARTTTVDRAEMIRRLSAADVERLETKAAAALSGKVFVDTPYDVAYTVIKRLS